MRARRPTVLVIEDSDDDYLAFQRACRDLKSPVTLVRTRNVEEAREYLLSLHGSTSVEWPLVVFLDLNLPGVDGRTFLQELKTSSDFKVIPVVIYSTSGGSSDVRFCYSNHANAYHQKPLDFDEMKAELFDILRYWTDRAQVPGGRR